MNDSPDTPTKLLSIYHLFAEAAERMKKSNHQNWDIRRWLRGEGQCLSFKNPVSLSLEIRHWKKNTIHFSINLCRSKLKTQIYMYFTIKCSPDIKETGHLVLQSLSNVTQSNRLLGLCCFSGQTGCARLLLIFSYLMISDLRYMASSVSRAI